MLDNGLLRKDLDTVVQRLKLKGFDFDQKTYTSLETERKQAQSLCESLQAKKNQLAKTIGQAKAKGESGNDAMQASKALVEETRSAEQNLKRIQADLHDFLASIPNLPDSSVPVGLTEADNQVVRQSELKPKDFEFQIKDHVSLAKTDFDATASSELSGSGFAVLKGPFATLSRALVQLMMDCHTQNHGYQEVNVPVLVKPSALFGTGQLPKFADDQFVTDSDQSLTLIPTAEVPLTNLCANQVMSVDQLPINLCAHSLCFRKEAGTYGQDNHGLFRVHQFEKVELVHICEPEQSDLMLEQLLNNACRILDLLQLPYQVVALCGGDLGFSAQKTYDIEVWLPSQSRYREVSSCSNMGSFQARRMMSRYKDSQGKKHWVHTLNGSGLAIGRTLIALLENHQLADGRIILPKALQPYMRGETHWTA